MKLLYFLSSYVSEKNKTYVKKKVQVFIQDKRTNSEKKTKTIQNISTFTTKKKVFNSISSKDKITLTKKKKEKKEEDKITICSHCEREFPV